MIMKRRQQQQQQPSKMSAAATAGSLVAGDGDSGVSAADLNRVKQVNGDAGGGGGGSGGAGRNLHLHKQQVSIADLNRAYERAPSITYFPFSLWADPTT